MGGVPPKLRVQNGPEGFVFEVWDIVGQSLKEVKASLVQALA